LTSAAPDLCVQSIYTPGKANPGDAVAAGMEIVVRNQGTEPAATFSVGAYISTDAIITTNDTLLTGSRTTVTNLPAGARRRRKRAKLLCAFAGGTRRGDGSGGCAGVGECVRG
jgi:hypothetical protein